MTASNGTLAALLGACALLTACGGKVELESPDDAGGTSSGGTGASSSGGTGTGGRGTSGSGGTSASGSAGSSGASSVGGSGGGAGGMPPLVDPAVSERYRWSECGRIAPSPRHINAVRYATDGSIVAGDGNGAIRAYAPGSSTAEVLLTPKAEGIWQMELSADGGRLLRSDGKEIEVYAAAGGGAIGLGSGPLEFLSRVVRSNDTGSVGFSADGELLIGDVYFDRVAIWDAATGDLRATIDHSTTLPISRIATGGAAPVRMFDGQTLSTYTLTGEPVESFDLTALLSAVSWIRYTISPDGKTLLVLIYPERADAPWNLVAIDTQSGVERWRKVGEGDDSGTMEFSRDGYAVVTPYVYDLDDGRIVRDDMPSSPAWGGDLAPGGLKKLTIGELVAEWDLGGHEPVRLYGSHVTKVTAIDVSRDGRYFASHGDWAVLWEMAPELSGATPLVQGVAPDDSWNVAIAPDGGAMVLSGDNVALFRRDGSSQRSELPPPNVQCLSADWSFSPAGNWVAGTHYGSAVEVRFARDFGSPRGFQAANCGGGVAFSPDGSLLVTASLELFETETWTKVWNRASAQAPSGLLLSEKAVEFSPDGRRIAVTTCEDSGSECTSEQFDTADGLSQGVIPELEGDRVRYSPEGHWAVSGGKLLHLPSGRSLEYAADASAAAFTPQGGIIAGMSDGALVHYCRSSE